METIEEFIASEIYQNTLKEIKDKAHIEILDYERENKNIQLQLCNFVYEKLQKAELNILFVSDYIQNHLKSITEYSIQKINFYEIYSNSEESDEDIRGYDPFILIAYGIEFYFLNEQPDKLLEYIKKLRIPNASRYQKEITSIFDNNYLND